MDALDVIVIVVALGAALGGYRLGFVGRVTSWLGLAAGVYVAIRLLPKVVLPFATASPGLLVGLAAVELLAGALIGQALGLIIASQLHRAVPPGPIRSVDRAVGGVIGALGILFALWLLIPSIASVPGWPARLATESDIARWISRDFPSPPNALQVVRRLIGHDAPEVFSALRPDTSSGPPPKNSPLSAPLTAAVIKSTVKVEGQACNLTLEGSGFAVGPDLVATNAHVVAGEGRGATSVLLPSGQTQPATVVMFDPRRDLALLSVPGLGEQPLTLKVAHAGVSGAVFGHPEGRDQIAVIPARAVDEEEATGLDLYDQHTTTRDILVLAADIVHGDSGAPLVVSTGGVVGVVFATAADQPGTAYALSVTELQAALGEARTPAGASTGPCLSS